MKKQLLYPPLRDEFTKFGDKFEKIAHNEANGMYCYKRTTPEDGNIYHHYPSSAQFGFGTALCIRGGEKRTADKIAFYMANGFIAGRCQASP